MGISVGLLIEAVRLKQGKKLRISDRLMIYGVCTVLYTLYYMILITND